MKRLSALLLCLLLIVQILPAFSAADADQVSSFGGISSVVLKRCLNESKTEITVVVPQKVVSGQSETKIKQAICNALDTYCTENYYYYYRTLSSGDIEVTVWNISLRSGLLMLDAYNSGKTSRLNADEKSCLKKLKKAVKKITDKTGKGTIETELAIYDYICKKVTYKTYDAGDSRRAQCTSATNALLYGWGNCQAYADLFFVMTRMASIKSGLIAGKADGEGHIWNTVSFDGGKLLMVDVTFGDNPTKIYPQQSHYFFNFGLDRKGTHKWSALVLNAKKVASKTSDKKSYYSAKNSKFGKVVKDAAAAAKYCIQQGKKSKKYFEFLIKGKKVSVKSLDSAISKAIKNNRVYGRFSWSYSYAHINGNTMVLFNWQKFKSRTLK